MMDTSPTDFPGYEQRGIASLPVELMNHIFNYAYENHLEDIRAEETGADARPNEDLFDVYENLTQSRDLTGLVKFITEPTYFPYAAANVCTQWKVLLSKVPKYWTDVVIVLDGSAGRHHHHLVDPKDAHQVLSWSRDLPITVVVVRRPDFPSLLLNNKKDPQEQVNGQLVAQALRDHVHRCRYIRYDVLHSASLPSIAFDLLSGPKGLTELRYLRLHCCIDDGFTLPHGRNALQNLNIPKTLAAFPTPWDITMDGRNFVEIATVGPGWFKTFSQPTMRLTVSHLKRWNTDGHQSFTLKDMLAVLQEMPEFDRLTLVDLECDGPGRAETWEEYYDIESLFTIHAEDIYLEDLGTEFTADFFRMVNWRSMRARWDHLRIRNCFLGNDVTATYCKSIKLMDFHPAHGDLAVFLEEFVGAELSICRCSSFNDTALQALTERRTDTPFSLMAKLKIVDCENFSVGALKRFVEMCNVRPGEHQQGHLQKVHYLWVTGRAPVLQHEDRVWFSARVESFFWESSLS